MGKHALKAKDVVFATMVHDADATVVVQGGVTLLQEDGTGKPYNLPSSIYLPPDASGQRCTITVRDMTSEVITELGDDDIYEDALYEKGADALLPVDEWDEVMTLLDETKVKYITTALSSLTTAVAGAALVGVCLLLKLKTQFQPVAALYTGIVLGTIICLVFGLARAIKTFVNVGSRVIMDRDGNYIDVDTGKTNLNGGMRLPVGE